MSDEVKLRKILEIVSTFLAETAVLVMVFLPLDYMTRQDLTVWKMLGTLALVLGLLGLSIAAGLMAVDGKDLEHDD